MSQMALSELLKPSIRRLKRSLPKRISFARRL